VEIQRLVGRVLRPSVDLTLIPDLTLNVDCDVLEADGGTRVTAINGASVALAEAWTRLAEQGRAPAGSAPAPLGAISVGVVAGRILLDLCYEEDARAESDMNIVMDGEGRFLEVQASAEKAPFTRGAFNEALDAAAGAIGRILGLRSPPS
jgi:ribonuclease PH